MSKSDTESESKCGGATAESTDAADSESRCGASSSKGDGDAASKCGGSSGGSKKGQTAEKVEATIEDFDGEPGQLVAVGLGPGRASEMTTLAKDTLREADHIVGYTTYIELLPDDIVEGADDIYSTPMCGEVSRTEEAVDRTLAGNDVAIVGSGDPNVYALAGLALEILESKGATASMVDFDVVAGVPAAQSCAARLGAPLVNDTVTISLSDHLTSMPTIESRLHAAAKEGFTIAIYNPWSRKRRANYEKCCEILLEHRAPDTPVGIVHDAGRDDEEVEIVELRELPDLGETDLVDMTTTLLVGNEETYVWDDRMVTPRGYEQKYEY
ncbi:precorrin-3B C(17)-methyltransferase [Haloferax sp. Atlit-10N]|uniref:precorrin-3B C(17)-methyltransferase n=1 Tax=unclassified Haloferax TaxID=2625095 RepID=UPI000E21E226|nr:MULTISPECIES: precorrin-3B C(17)-methyltransferase [unclassified Haloferax]RDZ39999.1 precorrin-3B C(17)-methyltransferase [Haloferax sp. Atlit-19N]RDZ40320.1 precorrin-3B C(17)-methyltransferase [Haloferax sp. Atlit-16N]RDZ56753.1 precorrin-3B C(17)-methyltransferase [Haloferax sp. Atlit-10N]